MSERLMGWTSNVQLPKALNRFEVLFSDDDLRLTCHSASIPTFTVGETPISRMHNVYKVAGAQIKFDKVDFKFYDFVDNKAGRKIDDWWKQVYDINTSLMGFPGQYKRNLTLLMYGPDHSVVESWLLVGCFPTSITRQALDWKTGDQVQEVSLSVSIDEAKLVLSAGV
ncbi:MAG: hypothetical protein JHC33_13480 [Ignisphaera sp.]|jgi:hypothetical protein|nr:hypothetical protein [Ignisphaera sp.]